MLIIVIVGRGTKFFFCSFLVQSWEQPGGPAMNAGSAGELCVQWYFVLLLRRAE